MRLWWNETFPISQFFRRLDRVTEVSFESNRGLVIMPRQLDINKILNFDMTYIPVLWKPLLRFRILKVTRNWLKSWRFGNIRILNKRRFFSSQILEGFTKFSTRKKILRSVTNLSKLVKLYLLHILFDKKQSSNGIFLLFQLCSFAPVVTSLLISRSCW